MMVLADFWHGALHLQAWDCDCGHEGCSTVLLVAMIEPRPLWLTLAIVPEDRIAENVQAILSEAEVQYIVAHGIALCGAPRKVLCSAARCLAQAQVWESIPDWMARVPIETVWDVRRLVWGHGPTADFTRTVRALKALDAYVPELPEGPVPAPSAEVLFERQMRVAYPPEKRSMS